jgi:hypothetical protein
MLLDGCKLAKLVTNQNTQPSTYHLCLAMMMCNPPEQCCFFQECSECTGLGKLQNLLEENVIEHVTLKQWISTDRSTLETIAKPSDEFTDM